MYTDVDVKPYTLAHSLSFLPIDNFKSCGQKAGVCRMSLKVMCRFLLNFLVLKFASGSSEELIKLWK